MPSAASSRNNNNNNTSTSSPRKTPALEARKAERLRNKLLSMMPDPVDDPLFDAGESVLFHVFAFVFFYKSKNIFF